MHYGQDGDYHLGLFVEVIVITLRWPFLAAGTAGTGFSFIVGTDGFALASLLLAVSSDDRLELASAAAALQRRSRLIPIRTARKAA